MNILGHLESNEFMELFQSTKAKSQKGVWLVGLGIDSVGGPTNVLLCRLNQKQVQLCLFFFLSGEDWT